MKGGASSVERFHCAWGGVAWVITRPLAGVVDLLVSRVCVAVLVDKVGDERCRLRVVGLGSGWRDTQ